MRRRVLFVSLTVAVLSGALAIGVTLYRDLSADSLCVDAQARLHAPLSEAPSLDRIQASTAVSRFERAIELGRSDAPTVGWLAYARGLEDYQRGDLLLAEGEITSARHRLGDLPELLVLGAAVARGRSQDAEARRMLAEALVLDPDSTHGNLLAADVALDDSDGGTALAHLDALGEEGDRVAPVHNRRGLAHELAGRARAAETEYRRAVELDERSQEAWINLGRLRRAAGDHEDALACFDRAVRAAESDSAAHLGRGLARAATADVDGARADFERAAELAPNDAEPLLALGDLLRDLGRYDDAVAVYRRAIEREDADAASWLKLGNALVLLEDYEAAAPAFRAALTRTPDLAPALNGLGAALMHQGELEDAATALSRAAEIDMSDPNPLMNLALLHERAGDVDAARRAWGMALERDPGSAIARRRLDRLPSPRG
ncbi:MAG: tetratricopeptide repeat protein [Sandaracinaceae bacterium]